MKCDGKKPRCSNCITYEVECTYTAPSRTSAPKKRQNYAKGDEIDNDTQDRLKRLENLVQRVTERLDIVEKKRDAKPELQHEEASATSTTMQLNITRIEGENPSPKLMVLPQLDQVLPIVHIYLLEFNSVLPLFHGETLLRLAHDCYSVGPLQRDPVAWAALNVVLALARQHKLASGPDVPSSAVFLSRAESVLSKVVLGNVELLNIQVLVGMVMLLQAGQDLTPALVLIATTIRLAHSIGLHDRAYSAQLDPSYARQRACVFWLAYILDKDLSMRSQQPSMQADDDINLDLPSSRNPHDNEKRGEISSDNDARGIITTADGTVEMNYFTTRIQLATIEGGVYDYIYSTRSRKRSPEERTHALESVACALEQWKASIPSEFKALEGSRRVAPGMLHFLGALHSTSMSCTSLINQAHAMNIEWIASIRRYGRQGVEPQLPPKWEMLVGEARDLLVLFEEMGARSYWIFW